MMIGTEWTNQRAAGRLPLIFQDADPSPAKEQVGKRYAHGGGWHPFQGFKLEGGEDDAPYHLAYPNDPDTREIARTTLHAGKLKEETIVLFESSWVAIIQKDGDFSISRMD